MFVTILEIYKCWTQTKKSTKQELVASWGLTHKDYPTHSAWKTWQTYSDPHFSFAFNHIFWVKSDIGLWVALVKINFTNQRSKHFMNHRWYFLQPPDTKNIPSCEGFLQNYKQSYFGLSDNNWRFWLWWSKRWYMYFSTITIDILVMPERFFILVLETNLQNLFSTSVHQKPSD